jgi:hypothetical protein
VSAQGLVRRVWLVGLLLLAAALGLLLLAEVDSFVPAELGHTTLSRAESRLDHLVPAAVRESDGLHYAAHLGAGRILSLCPCTRNAAAVQYDKATRHARSRHQLALVTTARPHRIGDALGDAFGLGVDAVKWASWRLRSLA